MFDQDIALIANGGRRRCHPDALHDAATRTGHHRRRNWLKGIDQLASATRAFSVVDWHRHSPFRLDPVFRVWFLVLGTGGREVAGYSLLGIAVLRRKALDDERGRGDLLDHPTCRERLRLTIRIWTPDFSPFARLIRREIAHVDHATTRTDKVPDRHYAHLMYNMYNMYNKSIASMGLLRLVDYPVAVMSSLRCAILGVIVQSGLSSNGGEPGSDPDAPSEPGGGGSGAAGPAAPGPESI